jgi:hypothetical protein
METEACTIDVDVEKRAASVLPTMTVPYQETYTTLPGTTRKVCLDNRELMHSMCKGRHLSTYLPISTPAVFLLPLV